MVFFKAGKFQRLADLLRRVQSAIEREGGESVADVEDGLADAAGRVGLDLEVLRIADIATLEMVLAPGGERDATGKCWAAAEILFLDGLRAWSRGRDDEARVLLRKARTLYGRMGEGWDLPDDAALPRERIRRIEEVTGSSGPAT